MILEFLFKMLNRDQNKTKKEEPPKVEANTDNTVKNDKK